MSAGNGQAVPSLEDSIRAVIREPEARKAFREKWPMYDTLQLAAALGKLDQDIEEFEQAIIKCQGQKREWRDLLAECKRRDIALSTMGIRDA
jgi:hypothetical protein